MDGSIKKKLEKRNERIINAVIKKANSICPESIALIGVYGSFYTGDIHDKSDLDLCIVINDDEGWKLSSCFILDDVAFDIYCTPWDVLEDMAEYKNPYITKLLDLNVLYIKEKKFLIRYDELKLKAIKRLKEKFSIKDNENAEKLLEEGIKEYANIMLSSEYGECRYKVAGMLYNIEQAIYIYNKKYGKEGINSVVASKMFRPGAESGYWYDISTQESLESTYNTLLEEFKTPLDLCTRFEADYISAIKYLYENLFDEYNVFLDFAADNLGLEAVRERVEALYASIPKEDADIYRRNKEEINRMIKNNDHRYGRIEGVQSWMINRSNWKWVMDYEVIRKL